MVYLPLVIDAMFAKDLKNVNLIGKMRPYVVVSISGDPRASKQQRTAVDRSGNVSPTWNDRLTFFVEESAARSNRLGVTFRIRCEGTLGDKDIGEVHVPLIGPTEDGELVQSNTYQVRRPSGKPNKGELNFSYRWGQIIASAPAMEANMPQEPVTAQVGPSPFSPAPPTAYWYPPPQPGYPYPPPPLGFSPAPPTITGYWYPPPQPGYPYGPYPPGYPPVQQPKKDNWLAKLLGVELVKLCLGYAIADDF